MQIAEMMTDIDDTQYHRRKNICGYCPERRVINGVAECIRQMLQSTWPQSLEELQKEPGWTCPLGKFKE